MSENVDISHLLTRLKVNMLTACVVDNVDITVNMADKAKIPINMIKIIKSLFT